MLPGYDARIMARRRTSKALPREHAAPWVSAGFYDCTRCGACCVNPPQNAAEGFVAYVEIEPGDAIRKKPDLVKRYARDHDGTLHLQILADGRCKALLGRVGDRVRCAIYQARPSPCRRVEPGSELCRQYQEAQGLLPR